MRSMVAIPVAAIALAACGGPSVYEDESFSEESPYFRRYPTDAATTCLGAQQALLSQGYGLAETTNFSVKGVKAYQPDDDEHLTLEVTIVCMDRSSGGSTAYANAVQTIYALKASSSNAGLSVSGVGSISLPWTSDGDTLSKTGAETVAEEEFYERLFNLIDRIMR